jgi:hypothetical protein
LPQVECIVAAVSDDEHVRLDEAQQRTSELAFAVVDRSQFGGDDRVGSAFSETDGVYLWEGAPYPPWYFPNSAKFAGESGTSICTASMAIRRHDRIHPPGAPGLAKGAAIRSYSSFSRLHSEPGPRLSDRARCRNGPRARPAAQKLQPVNQLPNNLLVAILKYRHRHHEVDDDMGWQ